MSHIARRTYGTALHKAGQSGVEVADALRKASVTDTLDVYMGRGVVNTAAAGVIEDFITKGE